MKLTFTSVKSPDFIVWLTQIQQLQFFRDIKMTHTQKNIKKMNVDEKCECWQQEFSSLVNISAFIRSYQ